MSEELEGLDTHIDVSTEGAPIEAPLSVEGDAAPKEHAS